MLFGVYLLIRKRAVLRDLFACRRPLEMINDK